MPFIKFENLCADEDGMMQLDLSLSNDRAMIEQDFYEYPNGQILEFAKKLRNFPKSMDDTITYENGSDSENSYSYVVLNAHHNGIQCIVSCRKGVLEEQSATFFMPCEPATMNEIGKKLEFWLQGEMKEVLEISWKLPG